MKTKSANDRPKKANLRDVGLEEIHPKIRRDRSQADAPRSKYRRLRCVIPGKTYLITKKTNDDRFILLPGDGINRILLYTLILKALRYGILIHGFCFMSNHFHLVITDVRGSLPAFMREFLAETSKAIQVEINDNRQVWSSKRYHDVLLLDLDAAERELAYVILNPINAELTNPKDWPGLNSLHWEFGEKISTQRPGVYFSARYRPNSVSIQLSPLPPSFDALDAESEVKANQESRARIHAAIELELLTRHQELKKGGRKLAGAKRVLSTSRESRGAHPVQDFVPRFATKNPELMGSAIAERRWFEHKHEHARDRYLLGHRRTVFPPGTYGYRQMLGVLVAQEEAA